MEQRPKFEPIEKYNAETQQQLAKQKEYADKVRVAEQLVNALDIRYQQAVKAAVENGEDNRELLTSLKKEKVAALVELENSKEMQKAAAASKRTVTAEDILKGLSVYQHEFQKAIIEPAIKKQRKTKEDYIRDSLDVKDKVKFFEEQVRAAYLTIKPKTIGNPPYSVGYKTQQNIKHKSITEADLIELARGLKPTSLKPLTKPVKDTNGRIVFVPVEEE